MVRMAMNQPNQDPKDATQSSPGEEETRTPMPLPGALNIPTGGRVGLPDSIGNYEIKGELGRGGMGVVYLGWDAALERSVAIKVINPQYAAMPEFSTRFRKEAKAAARIVHPNIVNVYAFEEGDAPSLIMEYVEGQDLSSLMKQSPLPPDKALKIILDAARALQTAAKSNLIHRDVKPSNILVTKDGIAKVMDFGLSKMLDGDQSLTASGAVLGTPNYMSPEQAKGEQLNAKTDIYSLGCTLYATLAGRRPFDAEGLTALIYKQVNEPLPIPAEWDMLYDGRLTHLLRVMTSKDRALRPDWQVIIEEIESMLSGAPQSAAFSSLTWEPIPTGPSPTPPTASAPGAETASAATAHVAPSRFRWGWVWKGAAAIAGLFFLLIVADAILGDDPAEGNRERSLSAPADPPDAEAERVPSLADLPRDVRIQYLELASADSFISFQEQQTAGGPAYFIEFERLGEVDDMLIAENGDVLDYQFETEPSSRAPVLAEVPDQIRERLQVPADANQVANRILQLRADIQTFLRNGNFKDAKDAIDEVVEMDVAASTLQSYSNLKQLVDRAEDVDLYLEEAIGRAASIQDRADEAHEFLLENLDDPESEEIWEALLYLFVIDDQRAESVFTEQMMFREDARDQDVRLALHTLALFYEKTNWQWLRQLGPPPPRVQRAPRPGMRPSHMRPRSPK